MKTLTVDCPAWIPAEAWELDGYVFEIEDKLPAADRDMIARRGNAIAIKVSRLAVGGISAYEDMGCQNMMADQWDTCRLAVKGISHNGRQLTPAERGEVLDGMQFISRDCLSNEVVGANQLGLKKS